MFKKLLLILVLIPFLSFAQYVWTDKGDYKYHNYSNVLRQVFFSKTGDSVIVSAEKRIGFLGKDGDYFGSISNYNVDLDYCVSVNSDLSSYILYDTEKRYDELPVFLKVYSFGDRKLIKQDSIIFYNYDHMPYYSSFYNTLIEYSSEFDTFYKSYNKNHGNHQDISYYSSSYSQKYKFSTTMKYYFYSSNHRVQDGHSSDYHSNEYTYKNILFNQKQSDTILYYYKRNYYLWNNNTPIESKHEKTGIPYDMVAFSKDESNALFSKGTQLSLYKLNPVLLEKTIDIGFTPWKYEFTNDNDKVILIHNKSVYILDLRTEQMSKLIKIDELEDDCKFVTHPADIERLAIISKGNLFLYNIDFDAEPKADYECHQKTYLLTDSVRFYDLSIGHNLEYEWDFGDGNTSNEKNPSHLYKKHGKYSVKLTVTNENGVDDTTNIDYISIVEQELFADFEINLEDTEFPMECDLRDKSDGENYERKWKLNNDIIVRDLDSTSFLIKSPGKYPVQLHISKGIFHDTKYDTVEVKANYEKIDNLVNEKIISTNHKLETYNILEYDDNYYFNFVYDSVDIGYVSEIYKMDKDFNYNKQMKFEGYSYPPYEPTIYKDKLIFKYDSSLSMNDLSYLGTDFEGNIQFNYSEMFSKNLSLKFPAHQINTIKMKVYNDSLYVLGNYGYGNVGNGNNGYESAKSYLYKINSAYYQAVPIDSLTYERNYDTDFFVYSDNKIAFSYLYYNTTNFLPYDLVHPMVIYNDYEFGSGANYGEKVRLRDNYLSDSIVVSLYYNIYDHRDKNTNKKVYINRLLYHDISKKIVYKYDVSENSKLNRIIRKGDSLYIAGSNEYEAAFYIYNLKSNEIDSVILENRIGQFTDLRFNDKGNLVLFGKLSNNLNDKIYIAEYDFDLTDNSSDTSSVEQPEEPPEEPDDTTDISDIVSYYPNPAGEELLVKYISEGNEAIEINVLDISGRELFAATINAVKGENDYYLQIAHIAPGVYLLNIKTEKGIISRKFIKR